MKWYSIREYKPPIEVMCFIFTENNSFYCGQLIECDNPDVWSVNYTCEGCEEDGQYQVYGITHFCIPDPVELEKSLDCL